VVGVYGVAASKHLVPEVTPTQHRHIEDHPRAATSGTALAGGSALKHRQTVEHWARQMATSQITTLDHTTPGEGLIQQELLTHHRQDSIGHPSKTTQHEVKG